MLMLIIGLTGGSGSGKSSFAASFRSPHMEVIDADLVYRALTEARSSCTEELALAFGEHILSENGGLSRSQMRDLVFGDTPAHQERRELLNSITHRYVREEILRLLDLYRNAGCRAVLLDVPLLFESGMEKLCDTVIAVTAPYRDRLARILARDGIGEAAARARLDAQPPDSYYEDRADYLVRNDKGQTELLNEAKNLSKKLLSDKVKKQKKL